MKHIARTLIILLAAVLIAGIAIAVVNNTNAESALAGFSGKGEGMRRGRGGLEGTAAFTSEQRPEGFPQGRMERYNVEGGSLLGLSGLAKNLGVVAVIVTIYWVVEKLSGLFRNRLRRAMA